MRSTRSTRHVVRNVPSPGAVFAFGALPPLVIYAFLMDYYIAGLTAGATKG